MSSNIKKTNSDHIISVSAKSKILHDVTKAAAEIARKNILLLDAELERKIASKEGTEISPKEQFFDENDLDTVQDSSKNDIKTSLKKTGKNIDGSSLYNDTVNDIIKSGATTSILRKYGKTGNTNKVIPSIDFILVEKSTKSQNSIFSAKVSFSILKTEINNYSIEFFRILRAKKSIPDVTKPRPKLSRQASEIISGKSVHSSISNSQLNDGRRQNNNGIETSLSMITKHDSITGLTHGLEISTTNRDDISKLDKSVSDDLSSIRNIQLSSTKELRPVINNRLVGSNVKNQDTTKQFSSSQGSSIIIENKSSFKSNNSDDYKELVIIGIGEFNIKSFNDIITFEYSDTTVEFGSTYTYFITTVDSLGIESVRSKIVKTTIEVLHPPSPPKQITKIQDNFKVTLSILQSDENIEKFEIYRKEKKTNFSKSATGDITVINGKDGFITEISTVSSIGNGFIQIGESINVGSSGSTFIDLTSIPGKLYTYRVYSIDIFGNKSQSPREIEIFVNERSVRTSDTVPPSVLAEINTKGNNIKLTIDDNTNSTVSYLVTRRNLTLKEKNFTDSSFSSVTKIGILKSKNLSRSVINTDGITGIHIKNNDHLVLIDESTRVDNIYQYCVVGLDRFGEKTSCAFSQFLFVSRRPILDEPINLSFKRVDDELFIISWEDNNLDIDPLDRIGNRDDFNASSYKTLFQVERRSENSSKWDQFPLTEHKEITDKVSNDENPLYRPKFLEVDTNYMYRVASMQTGGFISNFSKPLRLDTFRKIQKPSSFRIKMCPTECEPFFVALNWNTEDSSGAVDKWVISRAVINNFAASTLNTTSQKEIDNLDFREIISIPREASRSNNRVDDSVNRKDESAAKNNILSGMHNFIDSNVRFGNTYFYKIKAVGISKSESEIVTRGIKITDPSFERKLSIVTTQAERNELIKSKVELILKKDLVRNYDDRKSKEDF